MSEYADDLVRQWEMDDPRDRWRHTASKPPSERFRNSDLSEPAPVPVKSDINAEELQLDVERMLVCAVCGVPSIFGFDVTVEGVRMGDVGSWRCADHHPEIAARYSQEQWAAARARGELYPNLSSEPAEEPAQ